MKRMLTTALLALTGFNALAAPVETWSDIPTYDTDSIDEVVQDFVERHEELILTKAEAGYEVSAFVFKCGSTYKTTDPLLHSRKGKGVYRVGTPSGCQKVAYYHSHPRPPEGYVNYWLSDADNKLRRQDNLVWYLSSYRWFNSTKMDLTRFGGRAATTTL
ncbi:hypothetical protein [Vibrio harveyi]|uniref:hypothetical protein n=1 Tax=Vibrio harveyi TaxID=669 RepID=UPI0018F1C0E7|nr:hypothetical protein [Vibrio harveyi]